MRRLDGTENPEAPTFANTIAALEVADKRLSQALSAFWALAGADSNDARQVLEREVSRR